MSFGACGDDDGWGHLAGETERVSWLGPVGSERDTVEVVQLYLSPVGNGDK